MHIPSTIGLIHFGNKRQVPATNTMDRPSAAVRKIFVSNEDDAQFYQLQYPAAEIVFKTENIIQDNSIDHVIIYEPASDNLKLVAEVLQTGKKVQIFKS